MQSEKRDTYEAAQIQERPDTAQKKGNNTMKTIKTIETACGRLCYSLTETVTEYGKTYGITIRTTLFGEEEIQSVNDISGDIDKMEQFITVLAENNVLPCTLKDIAEDYIAAECMV